MYLEEVIEQVWVLFQIEGDGPVIDLHIGDLDSHVLEEHMLPSQGRMVHHDHCSIVILVILYVQEYQLLPVVVVLANADEPGNVESCAEELQMLHQLLILILRIQCTCKRNTGVVKGLSIFSAQ